ncbi:hypothetical protein GBK02_09210 [Dechloromonas sp. TW-R-39-2]|uniref:hypothetical protein n=1 Tax=Dechloromonas sp. TW-R-39-2 TaxID=2654218 RepID=UPI00193DFA7D|nr:hypothetical protein [Dechloromonas sp. TW-R-39-2]QRM19567.1 hypothetical protein GBK02_09210 [Dechloromonas sp. TW-R-39-2]
MTQPIHTKEGPVTQATPMPTADKTGSFGVTVTTNTAAVSGNFSCVQMLTDATFSAFTETGAAGQALTGLTIPAGVMLFGKITGYQLTSGAVRAYNAK